MRNLKGQVCHVPGQAYFITSNPKVEIAGKGRDGGLCIFFFFKKKKGGDHTPGLTFMKGRPAPAPASESEMKNSQRNLELKECE